MNAVLDALAIVVGAAIVVATLLSALKATVLPRSAHRGLSRIALKGTRVLFGLWVGRSDNYLRRDAVMAMLGPISLILLLASWLLLALLGFTLMFLGATGHGFQAALETSGSSVFTLGTTPTHTLATDLLSYIEAGIGLLLVTLLITYLPSMYGAFSRRENGVSLLRVRAGTPPRAATLLVRYWIIDDSNDRLADLWRTWEGWFTDIEETHSTFPVLAFFRSPQAQQSWITAAGALLDAAAMWMAAVQHDPDPDAALCVRTGFQALQRIATVFRIEFDADPSPDDPISVSRSEWEESIDRLAEVGMPLNNRDEAWKAWRGWRVNYDTVLLRLARAVEAPPDVPWMSDRSPLRVTPARRQIDADEGEVKRTERRGFGSQFRAREAREAAERAAASVSGEPAPLDDDVV
jgi:hypothetical protein